MKNNSNRWVRLVHGLEDAHPLISESILRERERERDLLCVIVAPFHSKLKRGALAIVPNGPIVFQWHHASNEEIIKIRPYEQCH